jgi:hypothetical protein
MTDHDKKLISWLISALIVIGFVYYLIMPLYERIEELDDELLVAEMDRDEMELTIALYPATLSTNEELKSQAAEVSADYYDLMSSQEVDRELTNIVLDNGLESVNLQIQPMALAQTTAYIRSELAKEEEVEAQEQIYSYQVQMTMQGSETDYQKMVDLFTNSYPAIRVQAISYQLGAPVMELQEDGTMSQQEAVRQLVLNLELYMCDKNA